MENLFGNLSEIYLYPIKSLPGIKLEKALITKFGIAHPKNVHVVDRFLSSKYNIKSFSKWRNFVIFHILHNSI